MQIEKWSAPDSEKTLADLCCPWIESKEKSLYYFPWELLMSVLNKIQNYKGTKLACKSLHPTLLSCLSFSLPI